jgi:hypothetical protein
MLYTEMEKPKSWKEDFYRVMFWVVLVIAIVEGIYLMDLYMIGNKMIQEEEKCSMDICSSFEFYAYDYNLGTCECMDENWEIKKEVNL